MRSRRVAYLFFRIVAAGLPVVFLPGCAEERKVEPPPPEVAALDIVQQDVPVSFEYVAQTQSSREVNIQARVNYIILNWRETFTESASVSFWSCIINFLCCSLLAVIIAVQVFKEGRITINHIQSAVAIYLLLGLMWGFLYQAAALKDPGAFVRASSSVPGSVDVLKRDLLYYSFTTLTTVGYGDIAPVHPAARMLAVLEAIVGQLFPAILITWLVSMQILHRRTEKE